MSERNPQASTKIKPTAPRRDLLPVEHEEPRVLRLRVARAWAYRYVEARYHVIDLLTVALGRARIASCEVERAWAENEERARVDHAEAEAELAAIEAELAAEGVPSLDEQWDPLAMFTDREGRRADVERHIATLHGLAQAADTVRTRLRDDD